ncbi:transport protein [Apiospora rasikravindrae]|uniref:Transport protein n=1 Tax=Apiospora rasikravindrae TaxID=990691 RepID=A0ABR1SXA1_9PEZI
MHLDSRGRPGRPITPGRSPSNDKEKELLGPGVSTTETLSTSRFPQDGRLSQLPSSTLPWMNNSGGIRCLSLSPAPSSQVPFVGPPGYTATGKNTGRGGRATAVRAYLVSAWRRNQGPLLVCFSQFFAALMSAVTRLLELDEETGPMHPMMILFWRMSATTLFSGLWTYYSGRRRRRRALELRRGGIIIGGGKIDSWSDEILGIPAVRGLLVARSVAGFLGLYGLWYSMIYLPLAEAVVISFLAPTLAGYLCHVFLHDRFTRREQLASFLALAGVVLIARPISLLAATTTAPAEDPTTAIAGAASVDGGAVPVTTTEPTPAERLIAIVSALIGVLGGALTIVTLRQIGTRAHTLISVNYFSAGCTVVTTAALVLGPVLDLDQPLMRFALPASWRQAGMLVLISMCGFATQFLMTSGIAVSTSSSSADGEEDEEEGGRKKKGKTTGANRATAMIYTNMLFSAGFDRWLFGEHMGWVTIVGCALIVGSALWVVVTKDNGGREQEGGDGETGRPQQMREYGSDVVEEGVVLLDSLDGTGAADVVGDDDGRHTAEGDRLERMDI